jgi:hypothetical protein
MGAGPVAAALQLKSIRYTDATKRLRGNNND